MSRPISRRAFAGSLGAAVAAPMVVTAVAPAPGATAAGGLAGGVPARLAAGEPSALAAALVEVVRVQYGARLGAADLATIARQIDTTLARAVAVRAIDLPNGAEPDVVFIVHAGAHTP